MQLVVVNPAAAASAPRAERSELLALDADGIVTLLNACRDEELRRIVYVAVHTALRISEIMGLRWSDIDFDGRRASIARAVKYIDGEYVLRVPKSEHSRRSVALSQETVEAFKQQRRWQLEARLQAGGAYVDGNLVFAGPLGEVKSLGAVRSAFKRVVKRIGHPDLRFHSLRHTSATLALKAGVHPRIVSERLGHSRIDITMRVYSHVLPDMQRDAADALDAMLPPLKNTGAEVDRRQSGGN